MIISKKKFNQMIQEAVSKREEELAREKRIEDEFGYIRDDIRDIRNDIYRSSEGLRARITAIEKELHPEKFENNGTNAVKPNIASVF